MTGVGHYAVAHWLRFDAPVAAEYVTKHHGPSRIGPASALGWLFGPDSDVDAQGWILPTGGLVWGALGIYATEAAARATLERPERAVPLVAEAAEAWHVAIEPYKYWGINDWLGPGRIGPAFETAGHAPDGPIIATTSAGDDASHGLPNAQLLARARRFIDGILEVRATLDSGQVDGLLFARSVNHIDPNRDGMTFSAWRDETSMRTFAYAAGVHRKQLDAHRADRMFDRSSFGRYRVIASAGSWLGTDPVAGTR